MAIPARTLSTWLAEYRDLTTYARLRTQSATGFPPNRIIRSVRLHHQQVYQYGIHRGKIAAILAASEHSRFRSLDEYLTEMAASCPHQLFAAEARASKRKVAFNLDAVEIKTKRNHACRMAELVLQSVTQNKRRHDELQRFMLTTDSVTVAVEVPIYLSAMDLAYFNKDLGFQVPIETGTTLTGHIDLVQIRNGAIHVLDYEPGARLERPIAQLMVYALALSRRTGLKLFDFVCAWFDEHDYFEFYPLHVVHKHRTVRDDARHTRFRASIGRQGSGRSDVATRSKELFAACVADNLNGSAKPRRANRARR
jgi:hypothetical protein